MDNSIRRVLLLLLLFGEWVGWLTKDIQRKKKREGGGGGGRKYKKEDTWHISASIFSSGRYVTFSCYIDRYSTTTAENISTSIFFKFFRVCRGGGGGVRGCNVSYNIRKGEELGLCMFTSVFTDP